MIAYIDNDVVFKLAKCNLLDWCFSALGLDVSSLRVLGSLKYVAKLAPEARRDAGLKKFGEETFRRIDAFASQSPEIDDAGLDGLERFVEAPSIDAGEAQLMLLSSTDPASILITGDKRSLEALCENESLADIALALQGRVWCIEQLVLKAIDVHGFEAVRDRALPGIDHDTALKAAFGAGHMALRPNTERTLRAYVADLKVRAPHLLADV